MKLNRRQNPHSTVPGGRDRGQTLAVLIGCVSIYKITISLVTPLLSLILEGHAVSSTLIGGLAMMAPLGVFWGFGGIAGPQVAGVAMDLWNSQGLPAVLLVVAVVVLAVSLWPRWHHLARKS